MASEPKYISDKMRPKRILEELDNARKVKDDGSVVIEGFAAISYKSALQTYLRFDSKVLSYARAHIISKALHDSELKKVTPETFLQFVRKHQGLYLQKRTSTFHMYGTLSCIGIAPQNVFLDKSKITFHPQQSFDLSLVEDLRKSYGASEIPTIATPYAVEVSARTEREAFDIAGDTIDIMRSIWNLLINYNNTFQISFGRTNPINKIRQFSYRALFDKNYHCLPNFICYDPFYIKCDKVTDITKLKIDLEKNREKIILKLKDNPQKKFLEKILLRYGDALDHSNMQLAFLEMWSILEELTATSSLEYSHKNTLERACSLFSDKTLASEVANHLRIRRNEAIHYSFQNEDSETLVFQVKSFVEELLFFYINNHFDLKSAQEVGIFLDAPRDIRELKRKIHIAESALKYRGQ